MKLLKKEYNRRAKLRPLLWDNTIQLPLEDVYTRLKIVSRSKTGVQTKGNEVNAGDIFENLLLGDFVTQAESHEVNMYDDILSFVNRDEGVPQPECDEVNVYDIFRALDKGEDVMTLVEGNPGIGKTTFCLKLAYDWANQNTATTFAFPKFELVLLLKCRDIDGGIMDAIIEQLLPKDINENIKEKVLEFLNDIHNQEKILIILDGLDELPEKSKHHVDELLHRRILSFCYVLATCRQERGIDARKEFVFDVLLQIEGFTESDAFEYIRKHFKNVGPEHSLKGERLIEEIKENTSLHALRNNPLNLLLLCVIYEDYAGKLPSSRTELYQIIVRCLLRRYCSKHGRKAHKDDRDLEKEFEKDILALGRLAWECLLNDRHSFREGELKELERKNEKLVARGLGLLYKEESLKRLNPQHEYCFLHKSFQEFLAASYIAYKLRKNELNVFEHLRHDDLVEKYPQVFLFVAGMLGEEAIILFTQIGEKLCGFRWVGWPDISYQEATFFIESFVESGNAERMAATLCSFIPFPLEISIYPDDDEDDHLNCRYFVNVLKACQNFSTLQQPVKLTVASSDRLDENEMATVADLLISCSHVTTLSFSNPELTTKEANVLVHGLAANPSLLEFILTVSNDIPHDAAAIIGKGLAASKTLRTVTFALSEEWREAWVAALEEGLSAVTPLTSVVLKIYGPMSETAIEALEKLFTNKSLTSLSLIICGDMQDSLAAAVCKGLGGPTFLNSFDLRVNGNLSISGASLLERGLIKNRSLNCFRAFVYGQDPENWHTVLKNLRFSKKAPVVLEFHPDTGSKVTANHVASLRPVVLTNDPSPKQHFTVNLWGELNLEGSEGLCDLLAQFPLCSLSVNVRGRLTDGFADCIARCFEPPKALSCLTLNILGEVSLKGKDVLQEMSQNNPAVLLSVNDSCVVSDELFSGLDCFVNNCPPVKGGGKNELSLKINNYEWEDWKYWLCDVLNENASLTSLNLTVNNFRHAYFPPDTLEFFDDPWVYSLNNAMAATSISALSLTINNYSSFYQEWGLDPFFGLGNNTSLRVLTLTINNFEDLREVTLRQHVFMGALAANKSLTTLTLIVNQYSVPDFEWLNCLVDSLACNTSITIFNLTVNICNEVSEDWLPKLCSILTQSNSLKTFRLQVNDHCATSEGHIYDFSKLSLKSESLSSIDLTVSFYGITERSSN